MARDLNINEGTGGVEKITIPASPFRIVAADQECTEVLVMEVSGTGTFINIGGNAAATSYPLSTTVPLKVAVTNTNQINLFGTQNDVVLLLWRK